MDRSEKRSALLGYLLVFFAGVFWGTGGYYVTQMSRTGAPSFLIAFSGHLLALVPLLLFLLFKRGLDGLKISRKGLFYSILLGVLSKGVFKLSYDTSITLVGVSTGSILLYTAPIFTAIMSMLFFKEKLFKHQYLALILNLLGCVLMVTGGNFSTLNISTLGVLLGVVAAIMYALNSILGKIATTGDDSFTTTFYMILFSAITMFFFSKPWEHLNFFADSTFMFWAFVNAIVTGMLANLFFLTGLSKRVTASKATVIASSEVVVAVFMGVIFLKEGINLIGFFGLALVLGSIFLMNAPTVPKAKENLEFEESTNIA